MGYTNDWKVNQKFADTACDFPEEMRAKMLDVVNTYNKSADSKNQLEFQLSSIKISLFGDATHESFMFTLIPCSDGRIGIDSWRFCKTLGLPYDRVVKVFLSLLREYGIIDWWDHDGTSNCVEYRRARALAKRCNLKWYGNTPRCRRRTA